MHCFFFPLFLLLDILGIPSTGKLGLGLAWVLGNALGKVPDLGATANAFSWTFASRDTWIFAYSCIESVWNLLKWTCIPHKHSSLP